MSMLFLAVITVLVCLGGRVVWVLWRLAGSLDADMNRTLGE